MLTNRILVTVNPEMAENMQLAILDSLMVADHLLRLPDLNSVPPFVLQVTKATPKDSIALVHHYMETVKTVVLAGTISGFMINFF